jgi:hypothetical protein
MMTEKSDKLIEALTSEERQSVNTVLERIKTLSPVFKHAISEYFSVSASNRDPSMIYVLSSAPIPYEDQKRLIEVTQHIIRTQSGEQQWLICNQINEELNNEGFALSTGTAERIPVRM